MGHLVLDPDVRRVVWLDHLVHGQASVGQASHVMPKRAALCAVGSCIQAGAHIAPGPARGPHPGSDG